MFVRKLYNILLSRDRNFARNLRQIMGFTPVQLSLYKRAFTHKSIKGKKEQNGRYPSNNERLEYLGDAILDSVTAEYLFRKYPLHDEGFLTQMRSKMVNRKSLNDIAAKMHLDLFLMEQGSNRISQTMMGNTFEAFVGAIYLDTGYKKTRRFIIRKMLLQYMDVHELETVNTNYKSQLLEYSQKEHKTITYELLNHYRTKANRERFKISVLVDGKIVADAEDYSKKSAEQKASQKALVQMGLIS